jgi:Spy/CpxP family protein refolding chaperone
MRRADTPRERKREMAEKISRKRTATLFALIAVIAALAAAAPASAESGDPQFAEFELIASWASEGASVETPFGGLDLVASWAE